MRIIFDKLVASLKDDIANVRTAAYYLLAVFFVGNIKDLLVAL